MKGSKSTYASQNRTTTTTKKQAVWERARIETKNKVDKLN